MKTISADTILYITKDLRLTPDRSERQDNTSFTVRRLIEEGGAMFENEEGGSILIHYDYEGRGVECREHTGGYFEDEHGDMRKFEISRQYCSIKELLLREFRLELVE